ncbi:Hypothetical protein MAU_1850 [Metamycoplasma auris 15026]|uniref:Uncharacterized protein n=1 Tax=Metamycoplasma auris 15026 TaxID=1188233 RepID=N9VBU3_9BACT|nr:hypothetical protein [Metamycoplasma auris]ENY69143.1 Hypothetical protein MAU_1850 [Metamycoplasma auris 15026]
MEIIIKDKILNLDKRLNIITLPNQIQVYYDISNLKVNDQVELYVYWISPKKALGFKSYKELQLFCSLKQFELWSNLNDLHNILTLKNDYKEIIKAIVSKDFSSLTILLEIERKNVYEVIRVLQPEFTDDKNNFFVC